MTLPRLFWIATICSTMAPTLLAQDPYATDTTIVFEPINPDLVLKSHYEPLRNAWGLDLMISNNGFGVGGFFRREYSGNLSGFISLAISDVKDEGEVEFYNQYTGETFIPGKKNRLIMFPLTVGAQYRLFSEDIVDTFRPYVSVGIGPSMIFVAPYSRAHVVPAPGGGTLTYYEQVEFFSSLKHGKARYTVGAFLGGGAYFGLDKGTLSGISFRYYYIPVKGGIEILEKVYVRDFGGFFITLNFGSLF
jgi:hypothetical protein